MIIPTAKFRLAWLLPSILLVSLAGCNKTTPNPAVAQDQGVAGNPADGGLAPVSQAAAPVQTTDQAEPPAAPQATYDTAANEQPIYAQDPPPVLPEYQQPPCPGDDDVWTPGYWNYGDAGYYWVPGAWVIAPYVGALWTPPWWGFYDGRYVLHTGYWGPHVGFYGGIDYGYGYTGHGYWGGYWNQGHLWYNRTVTNVNVTNVRNVYNYSAPRYNNTRVSYNGGRGGVDVRPLPAEQAAVRDPHVAPVPAQVQHTRQAASNRAQSVAENHGKPQVLAAPNPLRTAYRAPAARPPVEAARPAPQPRAPETRAQLQPPPAPAARGPLPENRPAPEARPATPLARPTPAPKPQPEARPAPVARPAPEPRPEARPAPAARPETRPAPVARPTPEARPESRPAPEARPAPKPVAKPAAAPHPAPAPARREEKDEKKDQR